MMWDGHLGRITIAKYHIELSQPDTAPVHLALCQACPKTCELKKTDIDKMVADYIVEPAQIIAKHHIELLQPNTAPLGTLSSWYKNVQILNSWS